MVENTQKKPKKPVNLTMVMMTFLTLAVIFSSLAYGYGKVEMANDYENWFEENFDDLATSRGYYKLEILENNIDTADGTWLEQNNLTDNNQSTNISEAL